MFFINSKTEKTLQDERTRISRSTIRGGGGTGLGTQRLIVRCFVFRSSPEPRGPFALTSDLRCCSGHGVGPPLMCGSSVNDRGRGPRPLRSSKRHVVVAVRECRPAEVRDNHDHVLSERHVRGGGLRPDAGRGHDVRQYFGEREIR